METLKDTILRASRVVMSALLMSQGIVSSIGVGQSYAATSQSMAIQVRLRTTPNAVADLNAARISVNDGELQLDWTAPSNPNGAPMASYTVRYATFSITSTGGNVNTWWNKPVGVTSLNINAVASSGNPEFTNVSGLEPAVTYYFTMVAYDVDGSSSAYDTNSQPIPGNQVNTYSTDFPPGPPTGVMASASDGQIALNWTANPEADIGFYRIYREGNSPPTSFVAITTTSATNFTDTGLTNGNSYYYRISAVDRDPLVLESALSLTATGYPLPGVPQAPANFQGAAQSSTSILWTWIDASANESGFRVMATSGGAVSPNLAIGATNYTESSLSVNTAYSRFGQSFNVAGSSNSSSVTRYTLALPPLTLAATGQTTTTVSMNWAANGNPSGTRYEISQSLDNFSTNFSTPIGLSANHILTTATIPGLLSDTTYYFRVRAFNGDDIPTAFSNTITDKTDPVIDSLPPMSPAGLWASRATDGSSITLNWSPVTRNADTTSFANANAPTSAELIGYNIYESTAYVGGFSVLNPGSPVTSTSYTRSLGASTRYYKIRAVDLPGNESADSLVVDSTPELNLYAIADDSCSYMRFPQAMNQGLMAAGNNHAVNLTIQGEEQPIAADREARVYKHIRFAVVRTDTNQVVNDFSFPQQLANVVLCYNVVNGEVAGPTSQGLSAQSAHAQALPAPTADENLDLYWFNGVKWFKLGSSVDMASQSIVYTGNHAGEFQVRRVARAEGFSFNPKNMSHKIFTPNGDNLNDKVTFFFDNPNDSEVTGKIYDLTGAFVADMALITETLVWDGKDSSGVVVPAGVYVYQIKGEGKTYNGTVVVAR